MDSTLPKKIGLDQRSIALRKEMIQIVAESRRGHLASALSCMEILRVLYDDILNYKAEEPRWPKRDRLIFSKGQGCLALYALLADKGFFSRAELFKFCKSDGILGGHPEYGKVPGVEASTGSLGHGLPIGIGMAIHAKYEKANHRVFVILSDGETNEGSVWEAALCATKHKLDNLILLVDYNKQQSYGYNKDVLNLEPFADKWKSFGFAVTEVNGHDVQALKGISFAEENLEWHHKAKISEEEVQLLMKALENKSHA